MAWNVLFDRMDAWRHLPNYQLERRADLFFSLYLPKVLEEKLGFPVRERLIPEFPVRIGTIYPHIPINKSFKIDYVALSEDGSKAVLVELKTEGMSRRSSQDKYLLASLLPLPIWSKCFLRPAQIEVRVFRCGRYGLRPIPLARL